MGSALAPTFELLLLSRFVWGIGAAGSRVVATAIVRDRFEGTAMAKAMSQVMAVFMLVPVLAPTIGTGLIAILPWRSVFWFCAVWAVIITLWSLRLRESLDPANRRPFRFVPTVRGYTEVARTRVTAGYTISTIFLQGVFTSYLASSELLITDVFDREAQFPIIFGLVATLFALGAILNGRVVERVGIHRLINGVYAILIPLTALSVLVSVTNDGQPSFWVFMPLLGLTLGSFMFLMPNLNTAALGAGRPSGRYRVGTVRGRTDGGRRGARHARERTGERLDDAVLDRRRAVVSRIVDLRAGHAATGHPSSRSRPHAFPVAAH